MTQSPGTETLPPPPESPVETAQPEDLRPPAAAPDPRAGQADHTAARRAATGRRQNGRGRRSEMSHGMRVALTVAGALLVVVGIAGLVLPGIQGIVTILAGLAVLSLVSRRVHGWTYRALGRWPGLRRRVEKFRRRMQQRFHRKPPPGPAAAGGDDRAAGGGRPTNGPRAA